MVRQGSFLFLIIYYIYTYEHCSLTTAGVVTGATTNMYLRILFSLSFFVFDGGQI
ncbi:hypothetical protein HMPREF9446_03613 [Bacteroides fluxus YIT 12057]|uniref:Uncharacterized protein n=1 Tax=Bacteroides fluxus YIT 12057 TaxID=763034 RepID=F3PXW5_9BACE|nr:hypothetical protein HMPREF9446_03613 [Bacteroides fluxus YIT 12057]